MIVKTMVLGDLKSNTYVLTDEDTKESVIIDPATDPLKIQKLISEYGLSIKAIFVTHGHFDHIGSVDTLQSVYECPVYTSQGESEIMSDSTMNLSGYFNHNLVKATATHFVEHDDIISLTPELTFKIIFVPGHSPDGVCYYNKENDMLFAGDTLMEGRIGSTDYYVGSSYDLVENIKNRLMVLPDKTVIYPGHGKDSTIAHERKHNHYFCKSMWI